MKSFSESLRITKNINLAKNCFNLMAEKGIDPNRFVDWYIDFNDTYGDFKLNEAAEKWLETEISINEGMFDNIKQGFQNGFQNAKQGVQNFMGKFGQNQTQEPQYAQAADSAEKALNNLHRRMGVSDTLMNALGGQPFMQMILQLIQILRSKNWNQIAFQQAAPPNNPTLAMPQQLSLANTGGTTESLVQTLKLKNEIRSNLRKIQSQGIDIQELIEWYAERIQTLEENWWDGAGEFLGNQWANASGSFNRWLKGEKGKPWGHDAQQRVTKKNSEAVATAMQSLQTLQQSLGSQILPQFAQMLGNITQKLQGASQSPSIDQPDQNNQNNQNDQPLQLAPDQDLKLAPDQQEKPDDSYHLAKDSAVDQNQNQPPTANSNSNQAPKMREPDIASDVHTPPTQTQTPQSPKKYGQMIDDEPDDEPIDWPNSNSASDREPVDPQWAKLQEPNSQMREPDIAPDVHTPPQTQNTSQADPQSKEFWDTTEFKPQRDKLIQNIKDAGFKNKSSGANLNLDHNGRPSVALKGLIDSGDTDNYINSNGQSLTSIISQFGQSNESYQEQSFLESILGKPRKDRLSWFS